MSRLPVLELWRPAVSLTRGGRLREALPYLSALEQKFASRADLANAIDEDPESLWIVVVALTKADETELAVVYAVAFGLSAQTMAAAAAGNIATPLTFEGIVDPNPDALWAVANGLTQRGYGKVALRYLKEFERNSSLPAFTRVLDRDPSPLWNPPASVDPEVRPLYERLKETYKAAKVRDFARTFPVTATTADEHWDNADYLLRSGDVGGALIQLEDFEKKVDRAALARIIGQSPGKLLTLADHPALLPIYRRLKTSYASARQTELAKPERITPYLPQLLASPEEREFAIDELKAFGPFAVPVLLKAIGDEKNAQNRRLLTESLSRLDPIIVPALIGGLEGPDVAASASAEALSKMGGSARPVLPFLIYPAAQADKPALNAAANRTLSALTGAGRPGDPVQALTFEAEQYLSHRVLLGQGPVAVWGWPDSAGAGPKLEDVSVSRAEEILGSRLAQQALKLNPSHKPAQLIVWALKLDKAAERAGAAAFLAKPPEDVAAALAPIVAAGPDACRDLLRLAMSHRMAASAALATHALGRVLPRERFLSDPKHWGLIQGLTVPDPRVQFAAAQALAELDPNRPFAGSSEVAKTLGRFMSASPTSRAVVLSGDIRRANELAGMLIPLGYAPSAFDRAEDAFEAASTSAYVELMVIDVVYPFQGPYDFRDAFKNFRADARTAGIPILLPGTLRQTDRVLGIYATQQPMTASVIYSADPVQFGKQVERGLSRLNAAPRLSEPERREYAETAAKLFARIAKSADSPYRPDVDQDVWPLVRASYAEPSQLDALSALADVPSVDAQRRLEELAMESSRPVEERVRFLNDLARSIRKHSPLLTNDQERELLQAQRSEPRGPLKLALSAVIGALTPPKLFETPASAPASAPAPTGASSMTGD